MRLIFILITGSATGSLYALIFSPSWQHAEIFVLSFLAILLFPKDSK